MINSVNYSVVGKAGRTLTCTLIWRRLLCALCLLTAGTLNAADDRQQLLDAMPARWASAATAGDVEALLSLYSTDAFIHVVFTSEELRGQQQIRDYYAKYSVNPPKVEITKVEESTILATVGILSGDALVEFPDQPPMPTHFSIVVEWENDDWQVQLQHISRTDR